MIKEKIERFSKKKSEQELGAGFDHFTRVYRVAKELAKKAKLKYDDEVLHAASFLHDIELENPHEELSLKLAIEFLQKNGFQKTKIEHVKEVILNHTPKRAPKSNEAKLLHDADLLDFLGATGVARLSYATAAWWEEYTLQNVIDRVKKFRKIAYNNLVLSVSKRIAKNKIKFMDKAIKQLEKENGE